MAFGRSGAWARWLAPQVGGPAGWLPCWAAHTAPPTLPRTAAVARCGPLFLQAYALQCLPGARSSSSAACVHRRRRAAHTAASAAAAPRPTRVHAPAAAPPRSPSPV